MFEIEWIRLKLGFAFYLLNGLFEFQMLMVAGVYNCVYN